MGVWPPDRCPPKRGPPGLRTYTGKFLGGTGGAELHGSGTRRGFLSRTCDMCVHLTIKGRIPVPRQVLRTARGVSWPGAHERSPQLHHWEPSPPPKTLVFWNPKGDRVFPEVSKLTAWSLEGPPVQQARCLHQWEMRTEMYTQGEHNRTGDLEGGQAEQRGWRQIRSDAPHKMNPSHSCLGSGKRLSSCTPVL